ncbi:MAG: sulfotransferase [Cyclobacteriaceae bacterium]
MKKQPNFMIVGAGKSGTTALYEYLAEHPEVYMSPVKETNFFALEGTQMVDAKDDPEQMFHYPWSVTNWGDYQALFHRVTDEKAIGEVSPMYLYSPAAAHRIKELLPNTKIIAILRDPVDRLYSRFMHLARENRVPSENFEDALDRESIWWKRNDLVQEGFYHQHLSAYYELFDDKQIRVYLYDDLRKEPLKVIQDIYSFIGVDAAFTPDFSAEYNVSGRIQNRLLDRLIGQNSMIKSGIKKLSPALSNLLSNSEKIKKYVNRLRTANIRKEPLQPAIRRQLIDQVYSQEINALQDLLQVNLSNWLLTK